MIFANFISFGNDPQINDLLKCGLAVLQFALLHA